MTTTTTTTTTTTNNAYGTYITDTRKSSTKAGVQAIIDQRQHDDDVRALAGQPVRILLASHGAMDRVAAYLAARDNFRARRELAVASGLLGDSNAGDHLLDAASGCVVAAAKRLADASRALGTLATALGVPLLTDDGTAPAKAKARDYLARAAAAIARLQGSADAAVADSPTGHP